MISSIPESKCERLSLIVFHFQYICTLLMSWGILSKYFVSPLYFISSIFYFSSSPVVVVIYHDWKHQRETIPAKKMLQSMLRLLQTIPTSSSISETRNLSNTIHFPWESQDVEDLEAELSDIYINIFMTIPVTH